MNNSVCTNIILGTVHFYFLPEKKKKKKNRDIYSTLKIKHISIDFDEYRTIKMVLCDFHSGMKYFR